MNISVIASGSNGNSCLIEEKDTSILVDAGKSLKEINYRLKKLGKSLENLDAVLLTHAHTDHSMSVDLISRRYNVPLYMTRKTNTQLLFNENVKFYSINSTFKIKNLNIKAIETSHDVPSCGFVINKFGIFTDTGIITRNMKYIVKNLKGILLESNHDIDMLIKGNYPYYLKQRIFSDIGHLSNVHASTFIKEKGKHLDFVLLGHLSANNNKPSIAKNTFESIVKKTNCYILSREKQSGVWEI